MHKGHAGFLNIHSCILVSLGLGFRVNAHAIMCQIAMLLLDFYRDSGLFERSKGVSAYCLLARTGSHHCGILLSVAPLMGTITWVRSPVTSPH